MNGISYLSLDREILELMKKAGFRSLNISLVSANADVLARLKRPHTLNKYLDVVKQAYASSGVSYQFSACLRNSDNMVVPCPDGLSSRSPQASIFT
jgi:hypothetical protein